jgi:hypothetical protein
MHARLIAAVAVLTIAASMALPVIIASPAAADGPVCPSCGTVTPSDDGILGRVRSQVDEANYYESHPTACTDTDYATGVEFQGFVRWRLALQEQPDLARGLLYRQECWNATTQQAGSFMDLQFFDLLTGENLARLAMDQFFLGLPAPIPRLNPEGRTLVNLDTWLSVDNIPAGVQTSPPISVPGVTVIVRAEAGGVEWTMGDGSPSFTCAGTGSQSSRSCWHYYRRSSAGQSDGRFHGIARIVWIGTYSVNGVDAGVEIPVPRDAPFSIQVAEGQAVVVR